LAGGSDEVLRERRHRPRGTRISAWQLLPAIRDLYSRLPETYHLGSWEREHVLYSFGCVDDLADESEISAAVEVARQDLTLWRAA
jgi:hypothetical protein